MCWFLNVFARLYCSCPGGRSLEKQRAIISDIFWPVCFLMIKISSNIFAQRSKNK